MKISHAWWIGLVCGIFGGIMSMLTIAILERIFG